MLCLIHEVGRNDILVWYGRWAGQIDLLLALILHVPGHTASFFELLYLTHIHICFFSFAGCKRGKTEIHLGSLLRVLNLFLSYFVVES